jgi:hypothetical protein
MAEAERMAEANERGGGMSRGQVTVISIDSTGDRDMFSRATMVLVGGWMSLLLSVQVFPAEPAADPLTTHDPRLYLLIDDGWIAEQEGLTRVINQARPLPEPIIVADDPRTQRECAWGNVIREADGRFRMWYVTMAMGHNGEGAHEMAAAGVWGRGDDFSFHPRSAADVREVEAMLGKYAESTDGFRWEKPDLGFVEFQGSRRNNIVLNGEGASRQFDGHLTNFDGWTVVRDDSEADPARRYKMIAHWESVHCWDNHEISGSLGREQTLLDEYWATRGKYLTYSPDGLRWDQPLERVEFPDGGGDRFLVVRDHARGRWCGYSRAAGWNAAGFSHSDDLLHWSAAQIEKLFTPASIGYPAIESLVPCDYGNQVVGFVVAMDKQRGFLPTFLAARQSEGPWQWIDNREPLIPLGPPGSYYATGAVPLHNEPFIVGDDMLIYFNAFAYHQDPPCPHGARSIGAARLRRDGFVGRAPIEQTGRASPGRLRTKAA